jgi:hypothetical protein
MLFGMLTDRVKDNIEEVTVADINTFLSGLRKPGPVSKNNIRRNIVTMFGCGLGRALTPPAALPTKTCR